MNLAHLATSLIEQLGYAGITIGLFVDSAGVPIPSEVILPLAGAVAKQGNMNLIAVIVIGTLAQAAGAILSYWIGASGGLAIIKKYGKYVFFSEHELAKTQKLFEKRGVLLTFFGRCLPGIRTYIGYPAGVAKMPFATFVTASIAGSFGWTVILTLLGYQLAGSLDAIDSVLNKFGYLALGLFVVAFIWYLRRQSKRDSG